MIPIPVPSALFKASSLPERAGFWEMEPRHVSRFVQVNALEQMLHGLFALDCWQDVHCAGEVRQRIQNPFNLLTR